MRTVDPESWCRTLKNPAVRFSRSWKFGRAPSTGFEARLRQSFSQVTKEWFESTSAPSVKHFLDKNNTLFERVSLVVVVASSVVFSTWVLWRLAAAAPRGPGLALELATTQLPSAQVPFPAVAFCTYNLISKKNLLEYLLELYKDDSFNSSSIETVARNAAQLASLVTMSRPTFENEFLHLLHGIPRQTYNITQILFNLSPKCSDVASRCSWRGVAAACGALLAPRVTPNGYCCVFNGRYMFEDVKTPVKYLNVMGAERGLNVDLMENSDDFIYLRGITDGIEVHVFESSHFPLAEAGSMRTFTANRNACTYCAVSANVQTMTKSSKSDLKRCRTYGAAGAARSRGHCIARCRRRAAAALCGCVPPTLLPEPGDLVCTISDAVCLNKHRSKFLYFRPEGADGSSPRELQEELTDSLDCDCLPECARTQYNIRVYHSRDTFLHDNKYYRNAHSIGTSQVNMSVVKVYFDSENQVQYMVKPHTSIIHDFALLASVWYCVTSLNLVTLLELLFFWLIRLTVLMIQNRRVTPMHNRLQLY